MKVYSSQRKIVLDTLEETGTYQVKKAYIHEKYEDVACVMFHAYDWFVKQMTHLHKPIGADYPVWHSLNTSYLTQGEDTCLLELEIPESKLILFNNHGWERVLQMNYVGHDLDDEKAIDDMLRKRGISTGSSVFNSPHYPMEKRAILKSWPRIFDLTNAKVIRAATWSIEADWIKSFKA